MAALEHMGLGLAAKPMAPKVPLLVLMLSTEFLDVVWGIFYGLKLETMEFSPWSHSLVMALAWSLFAGVLSWLIFRDRKSGLVIGMLVFSHWIVDLITHPMTYIYPADKGLPLFFNQDILVGLGLYSSLAGIIAGWLLLVIPGLIIAILYRKKLKMKQSS